MSDNNAHPDQGFNQAVHDALVQTTLNVIKARNYHLLYNIDLSVAPSSTELELMYQRRHDRFLSICSLAIPYQNLDGTTGNIPVTPPYQPVGCQTFHTITIPRHTDGATVVVLVRESDNYIVAVRVFLNEQEALNAQWLKFKDVQLPQRFRNVVEMDYDSAYETIVDINFGKSTLSEIVEFVISLRTNPKQKVAEHGKLLFGSLFLLLGEAQRFRAAQNWILHTSQCDTPEKIPKNIADIFRKWSHLSKTCFEFYLAIYEAEKFGLNISGVAISSLMKTEEAHKRANTVLKFRFRDSQNNFCLSCLVGGELLLLKHDFDWCTRIAMRQTGYEGDLNMKNYNIKRRHGRNFEN